jgi:exodeoxyribonuclease VII small subunit
MLEGEFKTAPKRKKPLIIPALAPSGVNARECTATESQFCVDLLEWRLEYPTGAWLCPCIVQKAKGSGGEPADGPSFESALEELEAIVARMDDGSLSLEESLKAYQRGAELVKHCQKSLESVRQQVQVLDGELLKPADDALGTESEDA